MGISVLFGAALRSLHFVGVELNIERVVRYEAHVEIERQFVVDVAAGGHGSDLNWVRPARVDGPRTCAAEYSDIAPSPGETGARIWIASIEDDLLRETTEFNTTDATWRTGVRDEEPRLIG